MGNAEERRLWKNRGQQKLKVENAKMERQIIHLKNSYIPI